MLTVGELRDWIAFLDEDEPVFVIFVDADRGSADVLEAFAVADEMNDDGTFRGVAISARD